MSTDKKNKLLICYDFANPRENHIKFYDALKTLGEWRHSLEDVFIVKTDKTVNETCEYLKSFTQLGGEVKLLLVVDITDVKDINGWLSVPHWEFIRED